MLASEPKTRARGNKEKSQPKRKKNKKIQPRQLPVSLRLLLGWRGVDGSSHALVAERRLLGGRRRGRRTGQLGAAVLLKKKFNFMLKAESAMLYASKFMLKYPVAHTAGVVGVRGRHLKTSISAVNAR